MSRKSNRLSLAALAATLVLPTTLHATQNCAARDSVVAKLADGYGESFGGGGVQNSKRIYEVWFNEAKGTWTILMTRADGFSCIMASGTHWRPGLPGDTPPQGVPG